MHPQQQQQQQQHPLPFPRSPRSPRAVVSPAPTSYGFLWDLDETLILFTSLLDGSFQKLLDCEPDLEAVEKAIKAGEKLEGIIMNIADELMMYKEVERCKVTHISDVLAPPTAEGWHASPALAQTIADSEAAPPPPAAHMRSSTSSLVAEAPVSSASNLPSDVDGDLGDDDDDDDSSGDGKESAGTGTAASTSAASSGRVFSLPPAALHADRIADCYRSAVTTYEKARHGLLFAPESREAIDALLADIDAASRGWLSLGREVLAATSRISPTHNVIITSGDLVPTLSKLAVFDLCAFFPAENVYTSRHCGKLETFGRAIASQPHGASLVAIGDGMDEKEASRASSLPFFHVKGKADLERFLRHVRRLLEEKGCSEDQA